VIIDVQCHLGHWPFRRIRFNTAPGLVKRMDRSGIDKAVVASLDAIFYRDTHAGDEEMAAGVAAYRKRFILLATVNPAYSGWEKDLDAGILKLGIKGMRLTPQYHGYDLDGAEGSAVLAAAAERGLPVAIPISLDQRWLAHPLDDAKRTAADRIAAAVKANPKVKFIIQNATGWDLGPFFADGAFKEREFVFDIARMDGVMWKHIPQVMEKLGAGHLAFGTGLPMSYAAPALIRMAVMEASEEAKEKVAWRNAEEMFGARG
jgi:uncharacterized protein